MKKSALLVGVLSAISTMAMAQGSNPVTLYGRINVTFENQKNSGQSSVNRVVDNASRLGIRGKEDLGGGLNAIFQIESRFRADDGTGGGLGTRDSWVGLSGGFGTFKIGRMTTPLYYATVDQVSFHNHDTGTSSDALFFDKAHGTVRNDNSFSYATPSMGGVTFEFQHSLINEAPAAPKPRHTNFAVSYSGGPLFVAGGFATTRNHPATGDSKDDAFTFAATYDAKAVLIGLLAERSSAKATGFSDKGNMFRVSGMVPIGAHELHLNFGKANDQLTKVAAGTRGEAKQFTFGYNYNLSKRTKAYAFYTKLDPKGANNDFRSVAFGLRHNF